MDAKNDSVKESLIKDVLDRERLYLYGTPYSSKKPDFKNDSLFIDLERLLRLQGKDPKAFYKKLLTGRDSIRITPYDKPYVAVGAIQAMREKVSAKDTLCEIAFEPGYIFKDSLCQSTAKDKNSCNIGTGLADKYPYAPKRKPEIKFLTSSQNYPSSWSG